MHWGPKILLQLWAWAECLNLMKSMFQNEKIICVCLMIFNKFDFLNSIVPYLTPHINAMFQTQPMHCSISVNEINKGKLKNGFWWPNFFFTNFTDQSRTLLNFVLITTFSKENMFGRLSIFRIYSMNNMTCKKFMSGSSIVGFEGWHNTNGLRNSFERCIQ